VKNENISALKHATLMWFLREYFAVELFSLALPLEEQKSP